VIEVKARTRSTRSDAAPLVLVVEEDAPARQSLLAALANAGFRAFSAESRASAGESASMQATDLVLLAVSGVARDAVTITAQLRQRTGAPILVLSPRVREAHKVAVLDAGANDVIVKPFGMGELLARMRVWLRYVARGRRRRVVASKPEPRIRVDRERRALLVEGRDVHLTPLEYKLLTVLLKRGGAAVGEEQIIAALWGANARRDTERLKLHVRQLRHKLERDPTEPRHLVAEPGGGYRLRVS
jgi:two-component system KDP operon response regulator KdpE